MPSSSPVVLVPMAPGFEEIEAITIIDLLRRSGVTVVTAALSASDLVLGSHGIAVKADTKLSDVRARVFDAVVLPGGMPGASHLAENADLEQILGAHAARGAILAAICAAPMVLGKHGHLEGKRATCYPSFEKHLRGATVLGDPVVEDGQIITSRGPGTAIAFACKLIERLVSYSKADEIRRGLLTA